MAEPVRETTQAKIDSAISAVLAETQTISSLKDEQRTILKDFLAGKDVFALLPTGFGKSLIYQLAPLVAKKLGQVKNPIVVVVSPLTALIEDQIREAGKVEVVGFEKLLPDLENCEVSLNQVSVLKGLSWHRNLTKCP